jgi:hypothetical protein
MGSSYLGLLTAFYVDNGPQLPLWNRLPDWSFWILPRRSAPAHHSGRCGGMQDPPAVRSQLFTDLTDIETVMYS